MGAVLGVLLLAMLIAIVTNSRGAAGVLLVVMLFLSLLATYA